MGVAKLDDRSKSLFAAAVGTAVGVASVPLVLWPVGEATVFSPNAPVAPHSETALVPTQDPLIELMMRTDGSLSADALDRELRVMFAPVTPERLEQVPALLHGLRGLGLSRDLRDEVEATLIEILANAEPALDDAQIEVLAAAFVAEPERANLAKLGTLDQSRPSEEGAGGGVGLYEP